MPGRNAPRRLRESIPGQVDPMVRRFLADKIVDVPDLPCLSRAIESDPIAPIAPCAKMLKEKTGGCSWSVLYAMVRRFIADKVVS